MRTAWYALQEGGQSQLHVIAKLHKQNLNYVMDV